MRASSKRTFSLLVAGLLMIVALMIYSILVRPEYDTVQQQRAQLASKRSLLADQVEAITKIERLITQQQSSYADFDMSLSNILPPKERVADIMNQLSAIAQNSGATIQLANLEYLPIKPAQGGPSTKGLGSLRISLKLFSPYEGFKQFVGMLETNMRMMDLVSAKSEPAGRSDQNLYIYNLVVDTYYQAN